jgi:hypothetical protein
MKNLFEWFKSVSIARKQRIARVTLERVQELSRTISRLQDENRDIAAKIKRGCHYSMFDLDTMRSNLRAISSAHDERATLHRDNAHKWHLPSPKRVF